MISAQLTKEGNQNSHEKYGFAKNKKRIGAFHLHPVPGGEGIEGMKIDGENKSIWHDYRFIVC